MAWRKRRTLAAIFVLAALTLAGLWIYSRFFGRTPPGPPVLVYVAPGSTVHSIAGQLEREGLVASAEGFIASARLRKLDARLRAGEFSVPRGLAPDAVLDLLVSGPMVERRVTIPEGFSVRQIAELVIAEGIDTEPVVRTLLASPEFAKAFGLPARSLEGYLFPDTYHYTRGQGAKTLFTRMAARFFEVYDEPMRARQKERGLSLHQVVTLASLVEKETAAPEERPLVAAVFFNRLGKKMRLQSDPTVIYGLGASFNGDLTRADLERPTAYNTYTIPALPPGPIASPGRESLRAVLWPADTDALYFVARGDGTHVFSRDYKDHVNAVNRYQKTAHPGP